MPATDAQIAQIETFLKEHRSKITGGEELGNYKVERVIEDMVRLCMASESLAKCSLPSIGTAARQAYLCQLSIDTTLNLACVVPRKGVAHFERMYKGMLDLAYRSEKVLLIRAYTVYKADMEGFDYDLGTSAFIRYKPNRNVTDKDRVWEAVVCAYAVADLAGGAKYPEIMWRPELEEIRTKALQLNKSADNPWLKYFDPMCKKGPAKRVCNYVPQNPFLSYALGLEALDEAGKLPDIDPAFADVHDKPIPTNHQGLAERVGAVQKKSSEAGLAPEAVQEETSSEAPAPLPDEDEEHMALCGKLLVACRNDEIEGAIRDHLNDFASTTDAMFKALPTAELEKLVTRFCGKKGT